MKNKNEKVIRASLKDGDVTRVKVDFHNDMYTPEEFTALFMAILESYTLGLLKTNSAEDIFKHFNNVFGIYLNKLVPPEKHYELSEKHKEFKETVDTTLGMEETPEVRAKTEDNRLEAYILAREILVTDVGMTPESADLLLNKRLGLVTLNDPKL